MVYSYLFPICHLEHSDSLRLRHAKRLLSWVGLCIKPLDLRAALHVAMQIAAILNAFRTVGRTVNSK